MSKSASAQPHRCGQPLARRSCGGYRPARFSGLNSTGLASGLLTVQEPFPAFTPAHLSPRMVRVFWHAGQPRDLQAQPWWVHGAARAVEVAMERSSVARQQSIRPGPGVVQTRGQGLKPHPSKVISGPLHKRLGKGFTAEVTVLSASWWHLFPSGGKAPRPRRCRSQAGHL